MKTSLHISFINSRGLLIQNDCLEVMSSMKDNSVNCIFADPPFNLNKPYHDTKFIDKTCNLRYLNWTKEWLHESVRVLKPGGSLFIYHMPQFLIEVASYLNTYHDMSFKNWIALNMKSGFPIKRRLHPSHYGLLYYVKNGKDHTFNVVRTQAAKCRRCGKMQKDYGGYLHKFKKWEEGNGKDKVLWTQISDFWDDTRPVRHNKRRQNKVNELPYEIAERALLLSTNKGDIVFDPFGGSGTTYFAACLNERCWVGSEVGDTTCIIQTLSECKNKIISKTPAKIRNVFKKQSEKKVSKLPTGRLKEVKKIIQDYKDRAEGNGQEKKNGRYSHRMSNKVFEPGK